LNIAGNKTRSVSLSLWPQFGAAKKRGGYLVFLSALPEVF
jgi:hypothetical protein